MSKKTFKELSSNQNVLFPVSLSEKIPFNHPVRIVNAGYGSEQNYQYMENNDIEAYVKYNCFHKEQKRTWKNNPVAVRNLYYNKQEDYYVCPMGQRMSNIGCRNNKSDLGYISTLTRYQATNCQGCPLSKQCRNSKENKTIEVNYKLNAYKEKAKERLLSQQGIYHRGKRCIEPEAVFGQIKHNAQFFRFRLRGLEKVNIEFSLVAIAHNLKKLAKNALSLSTVRAFAEFWYHLCRIKLKIKKLLYKKTEYKKKVSLFWDTFVSVF